MEVFHAIQTRRTIRKFKNDPVPDALVRKVLEAGILAPSASNLQRRKFFIIRGEAKKNFNVKMLGRFQLGPEPILIVVCAEMRTIERWGEARSEFYAKMDCAAAIMNMMTAAHALGLGTCWVGSFDEAAVSTLLKLPENIKPTAVVPLGYPDEKPEMPNRKSIGETCEFLDILPLHD